MTYRTTMWSVIWVPLVGVTLLAGSNDAAAKGCLKGAAAGAVAGHVAGHHAVVGAVAGCAVGHHIAKQHQKQLQQQQQAAPAPGGVTPQPVAPAAGTARS